MELENILPYGIILLLLALLVWDRIRFDGRERDLLNRLMARDYGEFVEGTRRLGVLPPIVKDEPSNLVSIDEAVETLVKEGIDVDEKREEPVAVRVT